MTQISASMVRELREKTGAGMMDCKKALTEAGDMEGAFKLLREKGLSKAAKKSSRVACEGLVGIEVSGTNEASMVELNCETDFVARNDDFKNLLTELSLVALKLAGKESELEQDGAKLMEEKTSNGQMVVDVVNDKIATIGEKISVRRFCALNGGDVYGSYIHGDGKIGVLIEGKCSTSNDNIKDALRSVAMHVAAFNPPFVNESEIPQEWLAAEKDIFKAQVEGEGKPANMVDKIVEGKMKKHVKEQCLLYQPYVKNPEISVQKFLEETAKNNNCSLEITKVVRFQVGEGMEKKQDNLADEVSKIIG